MTLAQRAFIEFSICESKRKIEDIVMSAAKKGLRVVETAVLPCHNEHVDALIAWMKSEGLTVKYLKWLDRPSGLGSGLSDDDEKVEYSKYRIEW